MRMLHRAIRLYEDLQVERALAMFREVISPSTPFVVSTGQRVIAYKYLGAAHATLGQPDSASVYFRAAIERDPFVDLDGHDFTAREREVFAECKTADLRRRCSPDRANTHRSAHRTHDISGAHDTRRAAARRDSHIDGRPVADLRFGQRRRS